MSHIALNNEVAIMKSGFYQLEKDKLALQALLEEVKANTMIFPDHLSRIEYLIENDYYYDVFNYYNKKDVLKIIEKAYSYDFAFQSYMAAVRFYKDYSLKTNDKQTYLESFEDKAVIVALFLAEGNVKKAKQYIHILMKQHYQPATPTYLNAGRSRGGEMISCFLLEMDDTLNSIGYVENVCKQLSKIGGGVAINLSKVRSRGEDIKGVVSAASGVLPVMKLLEDTFSYVNQLGQRPGAGAAYLNIFHADVMEFLDSKKANADEKTRIQTLSLGLITPRIFFALAERDEDMYVFAPLTVYKEYGIHLDDMDLDTMYYELVKNERVKKRKLELSARQVLTKIAQLQMESGYPYFMNKTNANEQHALKGIGDVKQSNLCTEIHQLQETSIINDYDEEDIIKRDISCVLGSLNIANVMDDKELREAVRIAMDMLTDVTDRSDIVNAPGVRKANREMHSVGLGALNLHGYLAKNQIPFESEEAKEFADVFFAMMNFYSIERSCEIAQETHTTFEGFEDSEYANGAYFNMYLNQDFLPNSEKVKKLFEGMYVPTREDWAELAEQVRITGLYHAYRLAIAPNQSSGYVQNATPGVMPIVDKVEVRQTDKDVIYYPMPFLSERTFFSYKSAYEMNQFNVIDMIATIQKHIDQGISCTLHVNSDVSTRYLSRCFIYAEKKGLKSLYYTRTRKLQVEECVSCSV